MARTRNADARMLSPPKNAISTPLDSEYKAIRIANLEEQRKDLVLEINDDYWAANESMKALKKLDQELKELGAEPKEMVLAKPEVLAISLSPGDRCYGWSIRWHGAIIDLFEDGTIHMTHPAKEEDEKIV